MFIDIIVAKSAENWQAAEESASVGLLQKVNKTMQSIFYFR